MSSFGSMSLFYCLVLDEPPDVVLYSVHFVQNMVQPAHTTVPPHPAIVRTEDQSGLYCSGDNVE